MVILAKSCVLLFLYKKKLSDRFIASSDEQQILLDGGNERSIDVETRSNYAGGACPGGRMCVPMSECTAMFYEVAKSCYSLVFFFVFVLLHI